MGILTSCAMSIDPVIQDRTNRYALVFIESLPRLKNKEKKLSIILDFYLENLVLSMCKCHTPFPQQNFNMKGLGTQREFISAIPLNQTVSIFQTLW